MRLLRSSSFVLKRLSTIISCILIIYIFYVHNKKQIPSKNNHVKKNETTSPFQHTLGFIRWNSLHPERIPLMEKYRPFFAELHYSMPNYTTHITLTADGWKPFKDVYKAVASTMKIILLNYSDIQGILYFHFDAWIQPLRFDDMDFRKIWFPDSVVPPFKCVNDTKGWEWWAWKDGYHLTAKRATKNVAKTYPTEYVVNKEIFCGGWSDIYYIPRHFFRDFIKLGQIFYAADSFHEVAIPTIINIIDLTYRLTPYHSVVTRLGDCWGHCCLNGASPDDIKRHRCGHRITLTNEDVKQTLIEILQSGALYLNRPIKNLTRHRKINI
ncbi:hypothetical protein I4U23_016019 [Adineta vaga]|nr:hypothetical protein I4U23_016019 [Adineta vaga]